jgi:hypothetical protein
VALGATAVPAFAATITQPSASPMVVPANGAGAPYAFTAEASGFEPGANVFIEQCDGTNTSDVFWDPTINCDLGSSPAPAVADASGKVSFSSTDVNHRFTPFKGSSPQGLFDCLAAGQAATGSGLPSFTNCQVRISTNNAASTSDQVFIPLQLPSATTKLRCTAAGSFTFNKPLDDTIPTTPKGAPKPTKPAKVKGAATLGTAAGGSCTHTGGTATGGTKYVVSAGSWKVKGVVAAIPNCSVVSNPKLGGVTLTVKWQGVNTKNGKLSTAGKSVVTLSTGTVAAIPTGGYSLTGSVTSGNFLGSTVRLQTALSGGVTAEAGTCAGSSLAAIGFTNTNSTLTIL